MVDWMGAFASKPAPTVDRGHAQIQRSPQIPCGSGLAREDGVSGEIMVDWTAAFASRLAPTFGFVFA
jgi:hypothetical protein